MKEKTLLYEEIFLIITYILVHIFDLKIENFTILYLCLLTIILNTIKYLLITNKYKKLEMKNWIATLINSFILILNIIPNKEAFIIWLGSIIIFKNLTDLFICKKIYIIEIIRFLIYLILDIILIILNKVIIESGILYLIILLLLIGISNIV